MKLEVGKEYKTRGGWKALVIWETNTKTDFDNYPISLTKWYYVIHKPKTDYEVGPIQHDNDGRAMATMTVNDPPNYDGKPADIIGEWVKEK